MGEVQVLRALDLQRGLGINRQGRRPERRHAAEAERSIEDFYRTERSHHARTGLREQLLRARAVHEDVQRPADGLQTTGVRPDVTRLRGKTQRRLSGTGVLDHRTGIRGRRNETADLLDRAVQVERRAVTTVRKRQHVRTIQFLRARGRSRTVRAHLEGHRGRAVTQRHITPDDRCEVERAAVHGEVQRAAVEADVTRDGTWCIEGDRTRPSDVHAVTTRDLASVSERRARSRCQGRDGGFRDAAVRRDRHVGVRLQGRTTQGDGRGRGRARNRSELRISTEGERTRVHRDSTGIQITKRHGRREAGARGRRGEREGRAVDRGNRRAGREVRAGDGLTDRQARRTRQASDSRRTLNRRTSDGVITQGQRARAYLSQGTRAREYAGVSRRSVVTTHGEGHRGRRAGGVEQRERVHALQATEGRRGERTEVHRTRVGGVEVERTRAQRTAVAERQAAGRDARVTGVGVRRIEDEGPCPAERERTRARNAAIDRQGRGGRRVQRRRRIDLNITVRIQGRGGRDGERATVQGDVRRRRTWSGTEGVIRRDRDRAVIDIGATSVGIRTR